MPVCARFHGFTSICGTIDRKTLVAGSFFLGAVTPIPFKLVCIGSGATGFPFWIFLPVALFGRVLRFAAFGLLFWFAGPLAQQLMRKHAKLVGVAMIAIIILGFAATSFLL